MPRGYRSSDRHIGDDRTEYDDRRNRNDFDNNYYNYYDDRSRRDSRKETSYSADEKASKKNKHKKSKHKSKKSSHRNRRESRREKKDESKQYDDLSSDDSISGAPAQRPSSPERTNTRTYDRNERFNDRNSRVRAKERVNSKRPNRTPSPPIPPSSKSSYVPRAYRDTSRSPTHHLYRQQDSYDSDRSNTYRHPRRSYKRSRRQSPIKLTRSTVNYATSLAAELIKKNNSTERLQKRINERNTINYNSQMIDLTEDASPTECTPQLSDKNSNGNLDSNVIMPNTPSENTPLLNIHPIQNEQTPKRYLNR